MNKSDTPRQPTPEEAREILDAIFEEAAAKLMLLMVPLYELGLAMENVIVARGLVYITPKGTVQLYPAGEIMLEMGRRDLVDLAVEIVRAHPPKPEN